MVIAIFKLIFIVTTLIWGVKIITEPGMLLEKIGEWAEAKVGDGYKVFDALLVCPFCMSSCWSLIGYGIGYLLGIVTEWKQLIAYPIVVCGSSMISGIIWIVFQLILSVKKHFDILNSESE